MARDNANTARDEPSVACPPPRFRCLAPLLALLVGIVATSGCERSQRISVPLPDVVGLSPGTCPIIHCNTWQTDALPLKGPEAPSQQIEAKTLDHLWSSPIAGGILDFTYADGRKIFWVPQVDRIMKLELDENGNFAKVAELLLEPEKFPRRSPEEMRAIVAEFDETPLGSVAYDTLAEEWMDYQLEGLRAYYALVNDQGILYVGNRDSIIAYADAEPGNPESGIVKVGQYVFEKLKLQLGLKLPLVIMIGINVTPDGWLIAVTIDGTLIAIAPDLSEGQYHNLEGERIWNSVAIDDDAGIYLAGSKRMHKLIWTGGGFSDREEDGAWSLDYAIGELDASLRAERGTGTTPALMGGEADKDQFVVVADAADVNNLMFLWRDDIPDDWEQLPGTNSRRIAGILPVDFSDPDLDNSYSENSATIFEYGAVLGNNQVKTNEAMRMPVQLKMKDPARTPYGVQKFQWNAASRELEVAWTRADVSSPNSTPVVAMENRQLHVVGLKDGKWVMEVLDWDTGATKAIYSLGESERFNPIMLALQILPNGDPIYASFGGIIHLKLGDRSASPR
ncbi:MAG: hypothetical protein JRG89_01440 [Deltaproteobacteria bacterium]|nr:hypothetical protein [Deltaproteobacteria bacterium]